jgi:hypothetical protein
MIRCARQCKVMQVSARIAYLIASEEGLALTSPKWEVSISNLTEVEIVPGLALYSNCG